MYVSLSQENINTMVRTYTNKNEAAAAFKHALGARDAFENLVHGKIDKVEFESQGYKLLHLA